MKTGLRVGIMSAEHDTKPETIETPPPLRCVFLSDRTGTV